MPEWLRNKKSGYFPVPKSGSYFPYGDIISCYDGHRYGCPYRRPVITRLCQIAAFWHRKEIFRFFCSATILLRHSAPCVTMRMTTSNGRRVSDSAYRGAIYLRCEPPKAVKFKFLRGVGILLRCNRARNSSLTCNVLRIVVNIDL